MAFIEMLQSLTILPPRDHDCANHPATRLLRRSDNPNRDRWDDHVREACRLLALGDLEKVVLAREMLLCCSSAPDIGAILEQLLERRDGSVCFALRRGSSTFLGATPERLVSRRGSQILTEALAGSAAASDPAAAQALLSGRKNQLEHSLVVREIMARLRSLGAEVAETTAPKLRAFGPLVHLHTSLIARKQAPPHVLQIAEHLHPTPAVGGIPRERALQFIRLHEDFDRGRYASPVGWFDRNGDGEFSVALRSGLLCGREARLYAGAGIVRGSDADAEWSETELKFRSFLDALGLATERDAPPYPGPRVS
jgi:isochorismate synthase